MSEHKCTECEPVGGISDISYNPDCPTCSSCNCRLCGNFPHNTEEVDQLTYCPFDDPCEDCGHVNYPADCPVWPAPKTIEIERISVCNKHKEIYFTKNDTNKKYGLYNGFGIFTFIISFGNACMADTINEIIHFGLEITSIKKITQKREDSSGNVKIVLIGYDINYKQLVETKCYEYNNIESSLEPSGGPYDDEESYNEQSIDHDW